MRRFGPVGFYLTIVVTVLLVIALFALYRATSDPLGELPLTETIETTPREGATSLYDAVAFCNDPATKLNPDATGKSTKPIRAPDSSGIAYRLVRGLETVEWVQMLKEDGSKGSIVDTTANHYTITPTGPVSEPIEVTADLIKCADEK